MTNWAEIDLDNMVLRVTVGDSNSLDGGHVWLVENLGGTWVKSLINDAAVGYEYDKTRKAFISPNPYPSWVLDEATCLWVAPTPKPDGDYVWDEQAGDWVEA
jgi:hypothetical protein